MLELRKFVNFGFMSVFFLYIGIDVAVCMARVLKVITYSKWKFNMMSKHTFSSL